MTAATMRTPATNSAVSASVSCAAPAGTVSADYQIAFVLISSSSVTISSVASGWTALTPAAGDTVDSNADGGADRGGTMRVAVYESKTAGTASFTVGLSGSATWSVVRLGFALPSGSAGRTIAMATRLESGAGSTSHALPSVNTTAPDSVVVGLGALDMPAPVTFTGYGNFTLAAQKAQGTGNPSITVAAATRTLATATTGVTTNFTSDDVDTGAFYSIVINGVASDIAPTANAGADASVFIGDTFARTATETGTNISARSWTVVSGPSQVGQTLSTTAALSFTPSALGTYVLRYTVTNNLDTATDDVSLTVSNPPAPTAANAGADASIQVNNTFARTATATGTVASHEWQIISGPFDQGTVLATTAALSWAPNEPGAYTLRYTATNVSGSSSDDVVVTVTALPSTPDPVTYNGSTDTGTAISGVATRPPNTAVGDLLLAIVTTDQVGIASTPAGWTLMPNPNTAQRYISIYTKTATQADLSTASYTFPPTSGNVSVNIHLYALSKADTTVDPVIVFNSSSATATSLVAPSVGGTAGGMLLCVWAAVAANVAVAFTPPASPFVERHDNGDNYAEASSGTEPLTASGATGTRTATTTPARAYAAGSIAIAPVPAAPTPAPTVDAGADATALTNAVFSRTATETGGTPTRRQWQIVSGPTGVNSIIGTTAALSWTPTVDGAYTLRYSAGNAGGTVTDDIVVTANSVAPTVNAGADASLLNRTTFTRTATETGSSITSREWRIVSGPAGVNSVIGTAATLSWTPTVPGTYSLQYSASNITGPGTDLVTVTVNAVVVSAAGRGGITPTLSRTIKRVTGTFKPRPKFTPVFTGRLALARPMRSVVHSAASASTDVPIGTRPILGRTTAHTQLQGELEIIRALRGTVTAEATAVGEFATYAGTGRAKPIATGHLTVVTGVSAEAASTTTTTRRLQRVTRGSGESHAKITIHPVSTGRIRDMSATQRASFTTRSWGQTLKVSILHPTLIGESNIEPPRAYTVAKFLNIRVQAETIAQIGRIRNIVITTANAIATSPENQSRNINAMGGYVTAISSIEGNLVWAPIRHLARATVSLEGGLLAVKPHFETLEVFTGVSVDTLTIVGMMSTVLAVLDNDGNVIARTAERPRETTLPEPTVYRRTFTRLR